MALYIDLLDNLDIFFHQPGLATPQLAQFVDRTQKLNALHEAHIHFHNSGVFVSLSGTRLRVLEVEIMRVPSHSSAMAQLCHSLRPLIPTIKHLYIIDRRRRRPGLFVPDVADSSQWLDILGPFITVEDLSLSWELLPHIVPALHKIIEEGTVEVLPSLQNLLLERESRYGHVEGAIEQLVAALHLSSRPISVLRWDSGLS